MGVSTRKLFRDDAVVLRTFKLGEADAIVSLLGRQRGRYRAMAKGLRRTSSKFGARLSPFSHVDLQLIEGRAELHTVTQAVGLHLSGGRSPRTGPRTPPRASSPKPPSGSSPKTTSPTLTSSSSRSARSGRWPRPTCPRCSSWTRTCCAA